MTNAQVVVNLCAFREFQSVLEFSNRVLIVFLCEIVNAESMMGLRVGVLSGGIEQIVFYTPQPFSSPTSGAPRNCVMGA